MSKMKDELQMYAEKIFKLLDRFLDIHEDEIEQSGLDALEDALTVLEDLKNE